MITLRITREGLEVMRYFPFIIFGNEEGGQISSSESPCPSIQITEKEVRNGNTRKNN